MKQHGLQKARRMEAAGTYLDDNREEDTGSGSDPEEPVLDRDSDGLTNYQEQEFGTDPLKPDTDEDGRSDFEEYRGLRNLLGYIG